MELKKNMEIKESKEGEIKLLNKKLNESEENNLKLVKLLKSKVLGLKENT